VKTVSKPSTNARERFTHANQSTNARDRHTRQSTDERDYSLVVG